MSKYIIIAILSLSVSVLAFDDGSYRPESDVKGRYVPDERGHYVSAGNASRSTFAGEIGRKPDASVAYKRPENLKQDNKITLATFSNNGSTGDFLRKDNDIPIPSVELLAPFP